MAVEKVRFDRKSWISLVLMAVALNGSPVFADDSGSGFFSGRFSGIAHIFTSNFQAVQLPAQAGTPVENASAGAIASEIAENSKSQETLVTQPSDSRHDPRSIPSPSLPATRDSLVVFSGNIPGNARWLMAQIQKAGESDEIIVIPVSPNSPIPNIYLSQGTGEYTVNLFVSNAVDSVANEYQYLASDHVRNEDSRDNSFLLPSVDIQTGAPEIAQLSSEITQGLVSDREKALAIHNWLTQQIAYDVDGFKDGSYTWRPQDARSVLKSKLAVCQGYSSLFTALARSVGIRAKIVLGRLIGSLDNGKSKQQICDEKNRYTHAWNEIYVDNRWMSVDATLDAGSEDGMTGMFKRTANNRELFDPRPSYFDYTHVKCSEERR